MRAALSATVGESCCQLACQGGLPDGSAPTPSAEEKRADFDATPVKRRMSWKTLTERRCRDGTQSGGAKRCRQQRMDEARDALGIACGFEASPQDVAEVLCLALTQEQLHAVRDRTQAATQTKDTPWTLWAEFGRHCYTTLSSPRKRWSWPMLVVCEAFQRSGWQNRGDRLKTFDVQIPRKTWQRCKRSCFDEMPWKQTYDNGRQGVRKFPKDDLFQLLMEKTHRVVPVPAS